MAQKMMENTSKYCLDDRLKEIVDIAIALKKPLLVMGEAGTGKTQLAYAIAEHLGLEMEIAHIKSTMKGEEMCYTYDNVLRLTDAQLVSSGIRLNRDISDTMAYVTYGPIGRAFTAESQRVLLLDEIDKTDSDTQDNLLDVLESYEFTIREAGNVVKAKNTPIIIVTSNAKRELSDPFLRRCFVHWIDFPTQDQMYNIMKLHYPNPNEALLRSAINVVYQLRQAGFEKPPATSELIDWFGALLHKKVEEKRLKECPRNVPFVDLLIKKGVDIVKYMQRFTGREY